MREHRHPRPAAKGARYGHTNLIAREWRTLAAFYETVVGYLLELQSWAPAE